ncbi:hypothetical protein BBM1605_08700 [Bifidobacterium breve MCC 1605]|nr:hypothetical protein BBM0476_01220 [Bifidobacterium breve MCC 0476]KOA53971.1 hypothetical protein BBM1454_09575 [Bifidobacterium breve MCC 1454]KOA65268.1 hypothetical protein BBM1605_08700 [Bifidobacterium breve MCC 1605]
MGRSHNYRTSHASPSTFKQSIGKRGRRAGIHITSMRHDYSFGNARRKNSFQLLQQFSPVIKLLIDQLFERGTISRIKRPRNCWRTYLPNIIVLTQYFG